MVRVFKTYRKRFTFILDAVQFDKKGEVNQENKNVSNIINCFEKTIEKVDKGLQRQLRIADENTRFQ